MDEEEFSKERTGRPLLLAPSPMLPRHSSPLSLPYLVALLDDLLLLVTAGSANSFPDI